MKKINKSAVSELKQAYEKLRAEMKKKWKRDLPLEELLFDRWERAKKLGFGKGASIYHNSYVYGDVKAGKNTWIGPFTLLDGTGRLRIGDYCNISAGVHIYTHDTTHWVLSGGKNPYEHKPVSIGNCCFIGPQTVIRAGVKIGNHVLVGANSFVNKNLPDNVIAVGTPARIVGTVKVTKAGKVILKYKKGRSK